MQRVVQGSAQPGRGDAAVAGLASAVFPLGDAPQGRLDLGELAALDLGQTRADILSLGFDRLVDRVAVADDLRRRAEAADVLGDDLAEGISTVDEARAPIRAGPSPRDGHLIILTDHPLERRAAILPGRGPYEEAPTVEGRVFIAPGDLTQIAAHAVAYSTSTHVAGYGDMYPSFSQQVPRFPAS